MWGRCDGAWSPRPLPAPPRVQVPDMSMRELLIELEVAMTAVLEYSPVVGWQAPDKVNLSIITLNHKMRGNSLPLPSAALRCDCLYF